MANREMNIDMFKVNRNIKENLFKRFQDERLDYPYICEDAATYGVTIHRAALSRYFADLRDKPATNKVMPANMGEKALKQEYIIFLCYRWNINIEMLIKVEKFDQEKGKKAAARFIRWCNKIKGKDETAGKT